VPHEGGDEVTDDVWDVNKFVGALVLCVLFLVLGMTLALLAKSWGLL
jgi:hypothetical protein